jgi:5-deoxy-glucuronate isomerase
MSTAGSQTGRLDPEGNVFRGTHLGRGRTLAVTPRNSSMRQLSYGRVKLDAALSSVTFSLGDHEAGFICLAGQAAVNVDGKTFAMGQYDALYMPRDSSVSIATESAADLAEFSAPVANHYPIQFVPYVGVLADSSLHFKAGGPATSRTLNIMIGKNVQAGRILAGLTISEPGNWTSWPPHEHAAMLEELYVYTEMPPPGFGIQLVYTDPRNPEIATIVREGDAVLMPRGYHPNVSAPGGRIGFLWAMAAHREVEDRQFGVVNVQPEFAQGGSGLEASRPSGAPGK